MADEKQAVVDAAWEWRAQHGGESPRRRADRALAAAVDAFRDYLLYELRGPGDRTAEHATKEALVGQAQMWRAAMVRRDLSCPLPREPFAATLAQAVDAHRRSIERRVVARAEGTGPTAWDKVLDPAF